MSENQRKACKMNETDKNQYFNLRAIRTYSVIVATLSFLCLGLYPSPLNLRPLPPERNVVESRRLEQESNEYMENAKKLLAEAEMEQPEVGSYDFESRTQAVRQATRDARSLSARSLELSEKQLVLVAQENVITPLKEIRTTKNKELRVFGMETYITTGIIRFSRRRTNCWIN